MTGFLHTRTYPAIAFVYQQPARRIHNGSMADTEVTYRAEDLPDLLARRGFAEGGECSVGPDGVDLSTCPSCGRRM